MNNLSQRLKREINVVKNESVNAYLRDLTYQKDTDYSLWKATNKVKKTAAFFPPLRRMNGTWAKDSKQKADAFAEYLEQTFQLNEASEDTRLPDHDNSEDQEIMMVTPKEAANEI